MKVDVSAQRGHVTIYDNDNDEEYETWFPIKFEVCGGCYGKGTHVNRAVDEHGISQEEFDFDPDFEEDYFAGVYDVVCNECNGDRVVAVIDDDATKRIGKVKELDLYYDNQKSIAGLEEEEAMERKMGC